MKLFVTVGTQIPFDRLVEAVDLWLAGAAEATGFAQIGPGSFRPAHMPFADFLTASAFHDRLRECTAVVAHAGMGSIITALQYSKPILVMPRRAALREHRNDHQLATARRFKEMGRVEVVMDESEIGDALERLRHAAPGEGLSPYAPAPLLDAVRDFIHAGRR